MPCGAVQKACTPSVSGLIELPELNRFALLASEGVPLAFGSDTPVTSMNPWQTVRAAVSHQSAGSAISPRAAFAAATRGGWRAGGAARRCHRNTHPWGPGQLRGMGGRLTWRSARRPTPSSDGPPIRDHGCPRCRDWPPMRSCRVAVRPFTGVSSSMDSDRPRDKSGRPRPVRADLSRLRPAPNESTEVIPAIEEDELAELDELDDEAFEELDEGVTGDPVADIDPDEEPEERGYRLTAAGTPDRWSVVTVRASRFGRASRRGVGRS